MNLAVPTLEAGETQALAEAQALSGASDALSFGLTPVQWGILGSYMQQFTVAQAQVIITVGDQDRSLYMVESGSLSVHSEDSTGRIRMVMVGPGSVVGEGSFFGHLPRHANVQAAGPGVLWRITPGRFAELSNRQPAIALQMVMGLAGVMARRMRNRARRIAVT